MASKMESNIESEENELENQNHSRSVSSRFPPSRTPLNSIPDPSQFHEDNNNHGFDLNSDQKLEFVSRQLQYQHRTPRVSNRGGGRVQSELNSAQSTPARSGARVSLGGCGARVGQCNWGKGVNSSSSRVFRGISVADSVEVPHFELNEDPSFWQDHNVQALIRIRPLSTMERVSQGHGRCLKQESPHTLVWLGHPETRFTFDHVACETISQEKLFRVAGLPMVENCMSGYNSCMFAYGQTGSGKTYTMMGEIHEVEGQLHQDCGITPRIFEYLFSRIRMEEENRREEKLKFSCKCSFLEIYNEQITDLLEPSSTNLQLREDLAKGVYVENLTEYDVRTVNDVLKLLLQGAANRKIAATRMNSESSRSHSVFTCIVESRWEKDSLSHFRFARLNLVDLAGSERQKSSGAEGDRLKEAANINKSLSTLGLVIMSLVDLAHGKHRHVPYRDSRLTFLLQDSLGGNSKTMIIANVSPSLCSANETLSTLKFAQRAKLIQNNAKVNEDASGDVTALQREIKELKGQLSSLMKNQNLPKSLSACAASLEESKSGGYSGMCETSGERIRDDHDCQLQKTLSKKMKNMEAILVGTLRRERIAETALQKSEAEIEHMSRLVRVREEDAQRTKMMLRFREEKIKQLEMLISGSLSAGEYLIEENRSLKEEIQLLQSRIDKNPELTRFALENIRLFEQLQLYQNFYEQGERETLLKEISELRDQLLSFLQTEDKSSVRYVSEDTEIAKELEDCRNMNSSLIKEIDELRSEVRKYFNCSQAASDSVTDSACKDPEQFRQADKCSLIETMSIKSDSGDEIVSYAQEYDAVENKKHCNVSGASINHFDDNMKELMDARSLIEAMESVQVQQIKELQLIQAENDKYREMLNKKEKLERQSLFKLDAHGMELGGPEIRSRSPVKESRGHLDSIVLQSKLEKLRKDLEEARILNCQYKEDHASELYQQRQVELIHEQVETETARTILHLQEEVSTLQSELQESVYSMTEENKQLNNLITAKEMEIRALNQEWEKATMELTGFIIDGSKSLKDASTQMESIICSFPHVNAWISDYVEKAAKVCIEKEETILLLQKSLEDAQKLLSDMDMKLNSLKGATFALNELQLQDDNTSTEDAPQLSIQVNDDNEANIPKKKLQLKTDQAQYAERSANAALLVMKWLSDSHMVSERDDGDGKTCFSCEENADEKVRTNSEAQMELVSLGVLESEADVISSFLDIQVHLAASEKDVLQMYSACKDLVCHVVREICEIRQEFQTLKENQSKIQFSTAEMQPKEAHENLNLENRCQMLHRIKGELAETTHRLNFLCDSITAEVKMHRFSSKDESSGEIDGTIDNYSTSSSEFSDDSLDVGKDLDGLSRLFGGSPEQTLDLKSERGIAPASDYQESEKIRQCDKTITLGLRKEFNMVFDALNKLCVQLSTFLNENNTGNCYQVEDVKQAVPSLGLPLEEAAMVCKWSDKVSFDFEQPYPRSKVSSDRNNDIFPRDQSLQNYTNYRSDKQTFFYQKYSSEVQATASQRIDQVRSFFGKFEEAHATIREADFMLTELVKANEKSKHASGMWRQAGEELTVERTNLMEELEQLKSSVALSKGECQSLQNQVQSAMADMVNSISLLEEIFLQMKRGVEEMFKVLYSDVFSIRQDMLQFISSSRFSAGDMFSDIIEKGFTLSVMYQCHIEKFIGRAQNLSKEFETQHFRQWEKNLTHPSCSNAQDDILFTGNTYCRNKSDQLMDVEDEDAGQSCSKSLVYENLSLKKELERKEVLLGGLLFDFRLLQESASNKKDIKDETDKLFVALCQVRQELELKASEVDDLLLEQRQLENHLADMEKALLMSNSDLERAKETISTLSEQNAELRTLVEDLYLEKAVAEGGLEEQKEVIKGLEEEILSLTSSAEKQFFSSVRAIEEDLRKFSDERDQLMEEIHSLNDKLEMAYALADEKEAIAVEARQESEASKVYAEEKEEEVKILENSIEELECTVNVLERRVYDMDEEVERHRAIRDILEAEIQTLRERLSKVESFTDMVDTANTVAEKSEDQISRNMHNRSQEILEANHRIQFLEKERAELNEEIKQYKEYISEILLHSEAQASQYHEKYKTLETMVREVKTDLSSSTAAATVLLKSEKSSTRTRGSGSPFRCIAGLVQQMNSEKDQELTAARLHVEELEALLATRQKEVCMLNTRIAAAESMTHDVIRDLLGVKLDMTHYANLVDQYQVQRLVEEAHQHGEEILFKEQEILNLKGHIDALMEERESCISDLNKKEADLLAAQISLEQLRERDQLLSAQNEMLKMDKTNLLKRVAELDQMVKTLHECQTIDQHIHQMQKIKDNASPMLGADYSKRLAHAQKLLSRANDELVQYRRFSISHPPTRNHGQSSETRYRRPKS